MSYLTLIEKGPESYGVFAPDIEGCIAFASARSEAIERYTSSAMAHFETLLKQGKPLPEPRTFSLIGSPYESIGTLTMEWITLDVPVLSNTKS